MPEAKPRLFTKKGPDGQTLTREVTGASSEVAAVFDGFQEKPASKSSAASSGSGSSSSSKP